MDDIVAHGHHHRASPGLNCLLCCDFHYYFYHYSHDVQASCVVELQTVVYNEKNSKSFRLKWHTQPKQGISVTASCNFIHIKFKIICAYSQ